MRSLPQSYGRVREKEGEVSWQGHEGVVGLTSSQGVLEIETIIITYDRVCTHYL